MTTRLPSLRQLLAIGGIGLRLAFVPALHAQGAPQAGGPGQGPGGMATPAERAQMQLTQLTGQLSLTPAQVTQIRPILAKQAADRQAMMASAQGDMAGMRTQMMTLNEAAQTQILALLTDAQKPVYQKLLEEQRNRRPGGPGGPGAGVPPAR